MLKTLSLDEKIRLLNGCGSWDTFTADGKLNKITMSDGPHGLRRQSEEENYSNINDSKKATCFPTASCVASSWNVESVKKMSSAIAKEAKAENVDIVLGCGMNIKRTPLCGRNFEYFSEDPVLAGELACGYVDGMQGENVGSCIKHFACNNQEKNRQSSSSNVDERTLREIYLKPFEIAVKKSKPYSIMTSYNMVNGKYASCNRHLLNEILRHEWGFDGIVISDWGAAIDVASCVKAGMDLAMPDSFGYFENELKIAFEKGEISESDIDTACKRIIKTSLLLNTLNNDVDYEDVDYEAQSQIALELALDSAVLLKNDGILPLNYSTEEKHRSTVIVVGSLSENMKFQGGGSSHINPTQFSIATEELGKYFNVIYEEGYFSTFCPEKKRKKKNKALFEKAIKNLKKIIDLNSEIPVLFFCGLTDSFEGEGFDRKNMDLPLEQLELYEEISKMTKNIVLVNFSGSPVNLEFAKDCRAILQMYLAGQDSGKACVELLVGNKNPCGHLAETWPLENKYILPSDEVNVDYKEGCLVGYRWYATKKIPVQYEFGFGLSYTQFKYSNLLIKKEKNDSGKDFFIVKCEVKNVGKVFGGEVVQLYIKNPPQNDASDFGSPSLVRPAIELAAFKKVFLKPQEKIEVVFEIDEKCFSVFSVEDNNFVLVEGNYEICVASSVFDLHLSSPVRIEGTRNCGAGNSGAENNSAEYSSAENNSASGDRCTLSNKLTHDRCISHDRKNVFGIVKVHKKGEFTKSDSLGLMAKESFLVRAFLNILKFLLVLVSESKSKNDPAVKISLAGLEENPLESLISTGSQIFNKKLVDRIVKLANRGKRK